VAGGAELAEFVAVGVSLGALGAGAQVRAQLITLTGRLGGHLLGVGADASGFGLGGAGGGLGAGSLLLGLPGLLPLRVSGTDTLVGLGAGLDDGGIALGSGGGHPLISVGAGLPHRFVPLLLGSRGALAGGLAGLGGDQVLAHFLGGGIGLGAELLSDGGALLGGCRAGFGGGSSLLSGGADRLHLGLGAVGR
jgi:hypothetical protein